MHPNLFESVNSHLESFRDSYDKILQRDLDYLKQHFDNILALTYDLDSVLWFENNCLDKTFVSESTYFDSLKPYGYNKDFVKAHMTKDPIQRIRDLIQKEIDSALSPLTVNNLLGWNKNSIYDFAVWELRELLSFYWFTRNAGETQAWNKIKIQNQDILTISISDLKNNFVDCMIKASHYFEIPNDCIDVEDIKKIHSQWLPLQKQIKKDQLCQQIVDALQTQTEFDWSNSTLSIIDEAWIQKSLFDCKIGIKCHGLDIFPTNTQDFLPLLEQL